jgi:hypothetical protein
MIIDIQCQADYDLAAQHHSGDAPTYIKFYYAYGCAYRVPSLRGSTSIIRHSVSAEALSSCGAAIAAVRLTWGTLRCDDSLRLKDFALILRDLIEEK